MTVLLFTSDQNGQKNTGYSVFHTKKQNPFGFCLNGGGGGIRTHGTRERSTVFKTAPINRSGTPPDKLNCNRFIVTKKKQKVKCLFINIANELVAIFFLFFYLLNIQL